MRLAVISDLHGNYYALAEVLSFLRTQHVDGIIGLGDYITDGPYPQKFMRIFYEMQKEFPCYLIRGNREDYILDNHQTSQNWKSYSSANGIRAYTAANLTPEDLAFFRNLPSDDVLHLCDEKQLPAPALRLCHGAPHKTRGNFELNPELFDPVMQQLDTSYLLGGHSHRQEITPRFGKLYVNPGSLGLALDQEGGHTHFAILTLQNGVFEPELFHLPYDVDGYLREFDQAGLEEHGLVLARALKRTLTTGVNYFFRTVVKAGELSGGTPLADLPESVWEEAERILK